MKKMIPMIVILLLLSACAIAPNFDTNEYKTIVDMRHLVTDTTVCQDSSKVATISTVLADRAKYLRTYSEFLPRNDIFVELVDEIINMTAELETAYRDRTPSATYCEIKLEILEQNLKTAQQITGRKPDR